MSPSMPTHADAAYYFVSQLRLGSLIVYLLCVCIGLWTDLSPGRASGRSRWGRNDKGAGDGLVAAANQDGTSPVGGVLNMGGLVVGVGPGDLDSLAVGGRETGRSGAPGKSLCVALTTLLGEASTKDCVGAENNGGKD